MRWTSSTLSADDPDDSVRWNDGKIVSLEQGVVDEAAISSFDWFDFPTRPVNGAHIFTYENLLRFGSDCALRARPGEQVDWHIHWPYPSLAVRGLMIPLRDREAYFDFRGRQFQLDEHFTLAAARVLDGTDHIFELEINGGHAFRFYGWENGDRHDYGGLTIVDLVHRIGEACVLSLTSFADSSPAASSPNQAIAIPCTCAYSARKPLIFGSDFDRVKLSPDDGTCEYPTLSWCGHARH